VLENETNDMSSTLKVKAIKIDVASQTIYEVEVAQQGLQGVYDAIGNGCELVEIAMNFAPPRNQRFGDSMWVDEEALFKGDNIVGGFVVGNTPHTFCNNALILGNVDNGDGQEKTNYTLPIELLKQNIKFVGKEFFENYEPTIEITSW
jgi:hypothetical protein